MMGYLTRPGFNGGGSVKKKPVLPKRKPPEEVKKRQKINYEKIKQYLGKESQELIEKELGFAIGGEVENYFYGGLVKEGKNKGKHKFTVGSKPKRVKYFTDYEEGKKWEAGERKIKYDLDKPKGKKFPKTELNKSANFLFQKNYDDLDQKQKSKAYDRVRNVFRTTGEKKFKAKNLESPLSKTDQAKIKKVFPEAEFKQGQKYGFAFDSPEYERVRRFAERGFKKAFEGGVMRSLPKYAQEELINAFPDVDFNFIDRSEIKTGASVAGYSKYGVPFDHPRYQSIRAYLDDPKPFRYGFNLRTAEGWTLGQMDRAALQGDTRYEPILQKPGKPISKNNKVVGIIDRTGEKPKRYNAENILKIHPNREEIIKYVDIANKSRTPLSDYPTIAKLLPEGFDPEKIQLNDLLQFLSKDRAGINRAKRAVEIHHTQGVRNNATGSFQLLRRDLNKLADTIEQQISRGNLDRVAELDAQRIRVETGGVKYGGRARTPEGDFRALLKGVETELQSSKFKPKDFAKALREAGFKCKFAGAEGGDVRCDNPVNYVEDMKRNQNMAMKGSPEGKARAFTKFRRAKSFLTGTLGPAALAGEALFSVPFALYDYSTGANRDEIISNLTFGIGGKSQEEQLRELYGEDFGLAQKAIETGERLENLDKLQQGTRGQRIRSKGKFDIAAKQFEEQLSPFIKDGQFDEVAFQNNRKQEELGLKKFGEQKAERAEQRKDALTGLEFDLEFAGGGIAKEGGVDSGVAPESGPTPDGPSEGLASLLKNGMKIKE